MISASGLICLALYDRLAAITARLRLFFRERFDLDLRLLAEGSSDGERSEPEIRLRERLTVLDEQCQMILRRVRYVRSALILPISSVVGMLAITHGCLSSVGFARDVVLMHRDAMDHLAQVAVLHAALLERCGQVLREAVEVVRGDATADVRPAKSLTAIRLRPVERGRRTRAASASVFRATYSNSKRTALVAGRRVSRHRSEPPAL